MRRRVLTKIVCIVIVGALFFGLEYIVHGKIFVHIMSFGDVLFGIFFVGVIIFLGVLLDDIFYSIFRWYPRRCPKCGSKKIKKEEVGIGAISGYVFTCQDCGYEWYK